MNFLAHIYLSGDDEFIRIGNFMADGIRGHDYLEYHPNIQKGVILHRAIYTFTDAHPIFRKSKHRLHDRYGHYSGVIIDIFYDHFLAKNWSSYCDDSLEDFARIFYKSLQSNYAVLTKRTKGMMPYMISSNWLVCYATLDGLAPILFQMDHRTKNRVNMHRSINELNEFYSEFEEEFTSFFEELLIYCYEKILTL